MPFRCLSHTRISMKWRALICVHSYFAFYFSSCECLCILFSCLVLSFLLLSEMQMFVLRRLRSVKCHSLCTHTHNFLPQPTLLLCSHGEAKNTHKSVHERKWDEERSSDSSSRTQTKRIVKMKQICENGMNFVEDSHYLCFSFLLFFLPFILSRSISHTFSVSLAFSFHW